MSFKTSSRKQDFPSIRQVYSAVKSYKQPEAYNVSAVYLHREQIVESFLEDFLMTSKALNTIPVYVYEPYIKAEA